MFPVGLSQICQELSCKEKTALAVSVIVGIACMIIVGLGASNNLPPQGNLPALIAGGVGASLSLICLVVTLRRRDPFRELREELIRVLAGTIDDNANYRNCISDGNLVERVIKTKDLQLFNKMVELWPGVLNRRSVGEMIARYGTEEMLTRIKLGAKDKDEVNDLFAQAIAGDNLPIFDYLSLRYNLDNLILSLHMAATHRSLECFERLFAIGKSCLDLRSQEIVDIVTMLAEQEKDPIREKMLDRLTGRP